ncbi:MAG: gamma-butyrobetaine hydroxylase-like domain-containing protein [Oceanococcus sp.]
MNKVPKTLRLQEQGSRLQVEFADAPATVFAAEFLRVFSPSAEVQGHGLAEPQLVGGKREVVIKQIVPVGRYAVRLVFSDGHDTGLYGWDTLQNYGAEQEQMWARYLQRMQEAGMSRDEVDNVMPLSALRPKNALQD